jgi:hypothetical protein
MGKPTKSFKTRIEVAADSETYQDATTWTPFARVMAITPPGITANEIDTTHLESEDEFEEADPGFAKSEDCTWKMQWEKDQAEVLYNLFRQKKGFRVVFADAPYPSGSKLRFNGWLKAIANEEITKDNVVQADITVRIVGKPDFEKAV